MTPAWPYPRATGIPLRPTLDFDARTRVRAIFNRIQGREPMQSPTEVCPGCLAPYSDSPSCEHHAGLCCKCVDVACKIERRKIKHAEPLI